MTQDKGGEMMFQRFFAPRPAVVAGRGLYLPLIEQARREVFYRAGRVPDTPEGRFELYTLHLSVLVRRLRAEGAFGGEAAQALFDTFLSGLDGGLREMGVGDLTVPKKMRKLGEALYGRMRGYDAALAIDSDDELEALIARTVYAGVEAPPASALAAYARAAADALDATPGEALTSQPLAWPEPAFAAHALGRQS